MSSQSSLVFPIAHDLGAKHTGVYAAAYWEGTHFNDFDKAFKMAFVAEALEPKEGGYKLLQVGRTANRHARRGRTRNRQAKRLLKQTLQLCFDFNVAAHDVAINHFMNRRGFSYVESLADENKINDIEDEKVEKWLAVLEENNENVADSVKAILQRSQGLYSALQEIALYDEIPLNVLISSISDDKKIAKDLKEVKTFLESIKKDLESGAKHRSKFFQTIKHDLYQLNKHHEKHIRLFYKALVQHPPVDGVSFLDVFYQLLCHFSNLDLKILNKILKDNANLSARSFEQHLATCFNHWIIKLWSASEVNGNQRVIEIKKTRQDWLGFKEKNPGKVFSFLCLTDPVMTIPPYESHTNRRPPSCQTLILNPAQLDSAYPDWKSWLEKLIASHPQPAMLTAYRNKLLFVTGGKGYQLVSVDEADARTLLFLLDASKETDAYKLNEIWSQIKKTKQVTRQGEESTEYSARVKQLIAESLLSEEFKSQAIVHPHKGSFWHLVNHYYQLRRHAREGRYFIHYDHTQAHRSRWQRQGNLLVMCEHRPRQLKHQSLMDVGALLGVSVDLLSKVEIDLVAFFREIRGLKTACKEAYTAQKNYGADLKTLTLTDKSLKKIDDKSKGLMLELARKLGMSAEEQDLFVKRNASIFTLAQLHSLVFGERSGFGKTCPVCATDNAYRMVGDRGQAAASRLNTLSMRLIDGALRRLLTHSAHHIANRVWPEIVRLGVNAKQITIPLIMEQNRFEFTSGLSALKETSLKTTIRDDYDHSVNMVADKRARIQNASKGICPYSGVALSGRGDVDHIIPRSGPYGTLNDEANLIYASEEGNRKFKGSRILSLSDLSPNYLIAQFGTTSLESIKQLIYDRLDNDGVHFRFGPYRQFIALDDETKIAFRHALLLPEDDPLRAKVINAISHRRKSKVNGTQRFMAQLLADILLKKAKKDKFKVPLSFDYFEISSNPQDENSTVTLRKRLKDLIEDERWEIKSFEKQKGKSQLPYSHIIDATLAFMIALQEHQGEGALRIHLPDGTSIWGYFDEEGVLCENMFSSIAVPSSQMGDTVKVVPQSNITKLTKLETDSTVKPHHVVSRMLFKQNALGLEFYDLQDQDGKLSKGYMDYSSSPAQFVSLSGDKGVTDKNKVLARAVDLGYYQIRKQSQGVVIYKANKFKLTGCIFDVFNALKNADLINAPELKDDINLVEWLFGSGGNGQLIYRSTKKSLLAAPSEVSKSTQNKYYSDWYDFYNGWLTKHPNIKNKAGVWEISPSLQREWRKYCRDFLNRTQRGFRHIKVKDFSLKTEGVASGIPALIKKTTPMGEATYHLIDLDNKIFSGEQYALLVKKSPNVVLFSKEILKSGYQVVLREKIDFKGRMLAASDFFNVTNSHQLDLSLDVIGIEVVTNTRLRVRGIPVKWFEENLLMSVIDENDENNWLNKVKTKKGWTIAKEDVSTILRKDKFDALLKHKPRSDASILLILEGDDLTMDLVYRSMEPLFKKSADNSSQE